jgi:hypothetical protein
MKVPSETLNKLISWVDTFCNEIELFHTFRQRILKREKIGLCTYGTTVDDVKYPLSKWREMALEELEDAMVYAHKSCDTEVIQRIFEIWVTLQSKKDG